MYRNAWEETVELLRKRIVEYHQKILDESVEWADKEAFYLKMQEDILILKRLLPNEKVEIKTRVEW